VVIPRNITAAGALPDLDDALDVAVPVARACGGRLRVLVAGASPAAGESRVAHWPLGGLQIDVGSLDDRSPDAFMAEVKRAPCDLLVKTAGPSHRGLGMRDLDHRLLHEVPSAVFPARRRLRPSIGRVAAAVRRGGAPPPLARRSLGPGPDGDVLGAAELLARALEAELHVVHAWTPSGSGALVRSCSPSERVAGRARRQERDEVRCDLAQSLRRAGTPIHPRRVHAFLGLPEDVLVTAPAILRVDALVVGGPQRPGSLLSRLLSMADYVVRTAGCSIMIVPRGVTHAARAVTERERGAPAFAPPSRAAPSSPAAR
jgi:nucleotide-binding universal stress UspA family protein